jgi:hypothetical protein
MLTMWLDRKSAVNKILIWSGKDFSMLSAWKAQRK